MIAFLIQRLFQAVFPAEQLAAIYEHFRQAVESDRFRRLRERGGQIQRPLWASTSTKNPDYPDTLYISALIGPQTVNTMPLDTIAAFRDHGTVECEALQHGLAAARQAMTGLDAAGISMTAVTDQLLREGVEKFSRSLHALLDTIATRGGALVEA